MLTLLVENLLNRNLARSPRARELCLELRGSLLRIELRDVPRLVLVESLGSSLAIRSVERPATSRVAAEQPAAREARVHGSIVDLLALAGPEPERLLQRGAVRIEGDAELAQSYRALALLLRPDLEEELARWIGNDALAHRIGGLARGVGDFVRRGATTTIRNSAEYLAHERGELVPRGEAEAFYESVEALREDADRLEARLAALEARRRARARR